jgi:hypothetical protein
MGLFDEKTDGQKSRDTVPLTEPVYFLSGKPSHKIRKYTKKVTCNVTPILQFLFCTIFCYFNFKQHLILFSLIKSLILVGNKVDMERGRQVSHQGELTSL